MKRDYLGNNRNISAVKTGVSQNRDREKKIAERKAIRGKDQNELYIVRSCRST
jgi:hypothetical protein